MKTPFDLIYVAVLNQDDKRVYTKEGQARSRITRAVDQEIDRFVKDCELWVVGPEGWRLDFSAKAGDHYSKITWQTVIEGNKRRAIREEESRKAAEEDNARDLYDSLRERFEK